MGLGFTSHPKDDGGVGTWDLNLHMWLSTGNHGLCRTQLFLRLCMKMIVIKPKIITKFIVTFYLVLFRCYKDFKASFLVVQRRKVGTIFDYISVRFSATKTMVSCARSHMPIRYQQSCIPAFASYHFYGWPRLPYSCLNGYIKKYFDDIFFQLTYKTTSTSFCLISSFRQRLKLSTSWNLCSYRKVMTMIVRIVMLRHRYFYH